MHYFTQIITAGLGALGYSVIFNIRRDKLLLAMFGAAMDWAVFLLLSDIGLSLFNANLIAAALGTLYAELLARIKKAPATCFLIPTVIPLIPGGGLFYTISAAISGNTELFQTYFINMIETAFGISIGIMLMSLLGVRIIRGFSKK